MKVLIADKLMNFYQSIEEVFNMKLREQKILKIAKFLNEFYGYGCWSKIWKRDREQFLELAKEILKIVEGEL